MSLQETAYIDCPYCGKRIELVIDCSIGNQEYIEDCQVCCRPISLYVIIDEDGAPRVEARREDE